MAFAAPGPVEVKHTPSRPVVRANPAVTPDRVVNREIVDTRDAEHDLDSRPREHVHDHVASCPLSHLAPVLRFTSVGITGWQYTPQVASL